MPTPLYDKYQSIANNTKESNRIILESGIGQDKTPTSLGLWGRIVQSCKNFFKSNETLRAKNAAVMKNFQDALNEKHSQEKGALKFHITLNNFLKPSESLQSRDVKNLMDLFSTFIDANIADHEQEQAEIQSVTDKVNALYETTRQKQNIGHQKTDITNYSQYSFNKRFAPKSHNAPARLIVKQKETREPGVSDVNAIVKQLNEDIISDYFVLEENKSNIGASKLLEGIDVNFDNIQAGEERNNFTAVFNSIVDDANAIAELKIGSEQENRITQQKNLLNAMERDPTLANKILDYFDKTEAILQNMYLNANQDDGQSFAEQFMHLVSAHNGFAKTNNLDKNYNFDQMLTIAARVGISRLLNKYSPNDSGFLKFANGFSRSSQLVAEKIGSVDANNNIKEGIITDENTYGAYQHIRRSLTRHEYSRCPKNFQEFPTIYKTDSDQSISNFDNIDWESAINAGITGYMKSELDLRRIEVEQPAV